MAHGVYLVQSENVTVIQEMFSLNGTFLSFNKVANVSCIMVPKSVTVISGV